MNLTPWAWLILPLGVSRAMQILLFDRITDPPRRWLLRRLNPQNLDTENPDRPYFSYLLECPWCVSVWLAAAAIGLVAWDGTRAGTLLVLAALGLSLAAVVIDRCIDRWLPDEAHTTTTLYGDGVSVTGPPGEVEDTFAELSGEGRG